MTEGKTIEIPNSILIEEVRHVVAQGKTALFRVKGNSMRIFLESGRDKVLIAPIKPQEIKLHDVVLAETAPQKYVLHRVIRTDANLLTLMGDGNIKGTEHCRRDQVIGKAVAFYRKGNKQPDRVDSTKWRIYSIIWLSLLPVRRIILGIYRRQPFRI